jgi:hypothetical protein
MSPDGFKRIGWCILVLTIVQVSLPNAKAQPQGTITLAWNLSAATDVAGYHLYEGTSSGVYSTVLDAGTNTTATVSRLRAGLTYYFVVTAYTSSGLESPFSAEISYTVPPGVDFQVAIGPSREVMVKGTAPAGDQFVLLVTQDLQNWTVLGSLSLNPDGSFQFIDPHPATDERRYYRLQQTAP